MTKMINQKGDTKYRKGNNKADLANALDKMNSDFGGHTRWLFLELDELLNAQYRVFQLVNAMESLAKRIRKAKKQNGRKATVTAQMKKMEARTLKVIRQFNKWSASYEETNIAADHFGGALDAFLEEIGHHAAALKSVRQAWKTLEGTGR